MKGLIEVETKSPAKTIPIPNPHPANPLVLNPAPIFWDASNKLLELSSKNFRINFSQIKKL